MFDVHRRPQASQLACDLDGHAAAECFSLFHGMGGENHRPGCAFVKDEILLHSFVIFVAEIVRWPGEVTLFLSVSKSMVKSEC